MGFTARELKYLSSNKGIRYLLSSDKPQYSEVVNRLKYEDQLDRLQIELIKLQNWVLENNKRVLILFEGREFSGKGGTINACSEHLNPRSYRLVALNKPTEEEQGQLYFKRYMERIPEKGEIVFFDRSWYNRAVVEPVNGFCTEKEYKHFMLEVNHFENMLIEDGIYVLKFYLSISKKEQKRRIEHVKANPLKRWQLSAVDLKAQELWSSYTKYTSTMLKKTDGKKNPWYSIETNDIKKAHLDIIKLILKKIPYKSKVGSRK